MNNKAKVVENIGSGSKNALFIYLTEPFFVSCKKKEDDTRYRPARTIVSILNDYDYSVDVVDNYYSGYGLDLDKYDLFFGQGELFESIAQDRDTYSIYYATGRYKSHIERQLKNRQNKLRERKDMSISLLRKGLGFNEGAKYADGVLALGNGCADTYREILDNVESVLFEPSTYIEHNLDDKDFDRARKNFLFLSGGGPFLKGLDLALDAFSALPDYNLYIAGPRISRENYSQNRPFIDLYREELSRDNVHNLKWLNKGNENFYNITSRCAFILSFSFSEGTNMSTLACMRAGLIPIVTQYSLEIDISDDLIIEVSDDVEKIVDNIFGLANMDVEKSEKMSYNVAKWAKDTLSWGKAEKQLKNKIGRLL